MDLWPCCAPASCRVSVGAEHHRTWGGRCRMGPPSLRPPREARPVGPIPEGRHGLRKGSSSSSVWVTQGQGRGQGHGGGTAASWDTAMGVCTSAGQAASLPPSASAPLPAPWLRAGALGAAVSSTHHPALLPGFLPQCLVTVQP